MVTVYHLLWDVWPDGNTYTPGMEWHCNWALNEDIP